VFIKYVEDGFVNAQSEPAKMSGNGAIEQWDGYLAPGMYTATVAMSRAIEMAKQNGIGAVAVRNTNHWMRGGTYGWQAADAGCIGICTTNTIANMPPWGGKEARLGNNPLIIAIPREDGHIVLDMAISQYSYGKMQEYQLQGKELPFAGGYDDMGRLTKESDAIMQSKRTVPIGFWKGSGLALVLDVLVSTLSNGKTTAEITRDKTEYGLSQLFLCLHPQQLNEQMMDEIISYTKSSQPAEDGSSIRYPGEGTLAARKENMLKGIPVEEKIWKQVLSM
jgi:3-dehydro-L-gulonate 2-dehydrogenase